MHQKVEHVPKVEGMETNYIFWSSLCLTYIKQYLVLTVDQAKMFLQNITLQLLNRSHSSKTACLTLNHNYLYQYAYRPIQYI